MDFDQFLILYAKTMMYYQLIEHDIKYLYAYMAEGSPDENYNYIETKTLGQAIIMLKEIDNKDDNPYIHPNDYNFLEQICNNRNHWAHKVFSEFMYIEDWPSSKEYKKQSTKLKKDHDRMEKVYKVLEAMRIEYCSNA